MFDVGAIQQGFGRAACSYDENAHLQQHVRGRTLALARQHWKQAAHILDAGCGTGALCDDVETLALGWRLSALDLSFSMCAQASQKNKHIVNANTEALPFADAQFDGVFSSLMLQWANDTGMALREMIRVIAPGGHAVFSTLTKGTLHELQDSFAAVDDKPHISDFLEPHRLLEIAEGAGFVLVTAKQDALVEHYPNTVSLMRSLQAIGATNKASTRRRGLMTSKQFARLEQAYQRFQQPQGLPLTWQIVYMVLRRV